VTQEDVERRPRTEADAAVLGDGLPALLAALELARRGARVVLVGDEGPSGSARGLGLALLGPGRPYATVAAAVGRANARLVWAAGCENQLRLKAFVEAAGGGLGYRDAGSFLLATGRAEAQALAESEDMLHDDGFHGEFLDHYMLETHFDLAGFEAGYWAAEDCDVDASALLEAARQSALAAGVALRRAHAVGLSADASGVELQLDGGALRASSAVVAVDGGASALVPELAPLLRPSPGSRLELDLRAGAALPSAARTADGRIAWQAKAASLCLAEIAHGDSADMALARLAARLPLDARSARAGEHALDATLDGLPLIGALPGRPLAVACGFAGVAPGLAFAAARFVADAILTGSDPTPAPLRAARGAAAASGASGR
jgi:glycine/D-amino acid oxidase-like deaminating enzyme